MTTSISRAPKDWIDGQARDLGFDSVGFASATAPWAAGEGLRAFVAHDRHGQMSWIAQTLERRVHPTAMWPQARSAIVLGLNYGPDEDPLAAVERRACGAISVYARGRDYHQLIKGRLKTLAGKVRARFAVQAKVFVDTAPLMEKPLAQRAGVGWQGKHTNLVSREHGSWLFLGVVLTTLDIAPDQESTDHCGACRACLDICPTGAFPAPYQLDARRCISYLTIEHAGPIPETFREALGPRIYGCDDCLAVCPWNKFAAQAREAGLQAREALRAPALKDLAALDDAGFRKLFAAGPVKRIGRDRLVRNVLYAIGNSGDPSLAPAARARLEDADPAVRDAARWALGRLNPQAPGGSMAMSSILNSRTEPGGIGPAPSSP
jgi:epoxyqueuosine reductase